MSSTATLGSRPPAGDIRRDAVVIGLVGMRVGRAEYSRVVKLVDHTPEVVNAYNVTGEDSWILEIGVIDVSHLDAVVSKFCTLTETSTSIILNVVREHQPMAPAKRDEVKPPTKRTSRTMA